MPTIFTCSIDSSRNQVFFSIRLLDLKLNKVQLFFFQLSHGDPLGTYLGKHHFTLWNLFCQNLFLQAIESLPQICLLIFYLHKDLLQPIHFVFGLFYVCFGAYLTDNAHFGGNKV
jgi:hypothetical protein